MAEGIEWEGQVLLGSLEHPLSARLIVTSQRLAFARGGEVVLDIARWWLKRPPFMNGDGGINLRIETGSGQRERLTFHARDGRPAASDIVTLLTHGKQALPSPQLDPVYTDVPKRRATRYEPEPAHDEPAERARPMKRAIEDDEYVYSSDVIDATTLQVLDVTDFPPVTETQTPSTQRGTISSGALGDPITISTLGNQTHRSGEWSLAPMTSMPTGRTGKAGWAFRLSGLVLLLIVAAAIGTSGLPDTSSIRDRGNAILAPLTGDETEPAGNLAQVVATATEPNRATDATRSAEETSIALGVGGETVAVPTETATTHARTATPEPTVTDEPTDTPEPTETDAPTDTATAEPTETDVDEIEPTVGAAADDTATEVPTATDTETATAEPTATDTATATLEPTATDTLV
ncbi:MAG: hypothetical protein M3Y37_06865, partial [Chloroflexota bacterium]|nr:hypothetical protein [Chloroflexota bacterium]